MFHCETSVLCAVSWLSFLDKHAICSLRINWLDPEVNSVGCDTKNQYWHNIVSNILS